MGRTAKHGGTPQGKRARWAVSIYVCAALGPWEAAGTAAHKELNGAQIGKSKKRQHKKRGRNHTLAGSAGGVTNERMM